MQARPHSKPLTITIAILTFLAPAAALHWTRVYAGPPAVDPFGMPWPEPFWHGLQYVAAGVIVLAVVLGVVGVIRGGPSRVAGIFALIVVGVFVLFGLALNGVLFGYSNPGF